MKESHFMLTRIQYEQRILQELNALPEEALPKVVRLLIVLKEEFLTPNPVNRTFKPATFDHQTTKQLLATSSGNWAQELAEEERSDRI